MRRRLTPDYRVIVDARPRTLRGLIAGEMVLGKSMLGHTLEQAIGLKASTAPTVVIEGDDDLSAVGRLLDDYDSGAIQISRSFPSARALVLRTDRLYEARRLRRVAAQGGDPESAVLWRLDHPRALDVAGEELLRRRTYQPLGRYWAFPLARTLARSLVDTRVRPNALTMSAGLLMLASAAVIAFTAIALPTRIIAAVALAAALVLDTADGHLARLQGTASPFGRWLDNILDELADVALHASIAWAAFSQSGHPIWLLLGMVYTSGKYLFNVQSTAGEILDRAEPATTEMASGAAVIDQPTDRGAIAEMLRGTVRGLGHADFRWHLWIVLALFGRLDIALVGYALYFPARTALACLRRGVRHACH